MRAHPVPERKLVRNLTTKTNRSPSSTILGGNRTVATVSTSIKLSMNQSKKLQIPTQIVAFRVQKTELVLKTSKRVQVSYLELKKYPDRMLFHLLPVKSLLILTQALDLTRLPNLCELKMLLIGHQLLKSSLYLKILLIVSQSKNQAIRKY